MSSGNLTPNTADVDGAALMVAREDKERIYPELTTSRRCRLVVAAASFLATATETGGMWSTEAVDCRETIGLRQSPGSALLHAVLHSPRLGTTLDADAVDYLLSIFSDDASDGAEACKPPATSMQPFSSPHR